MTRKVLIIFVFILGIPAAICADVTTYSIPGTYTYTIPSNYVSLDVQVWGGGGGGGGASYSGGNQSGGNGGNSSAAGLIANGGRGGQTYSVGAGGAASGGTTNLTGANGTDSGDDWVGGNGGAGANGGGGGRGHNTYTGLVSTAGTAPGGGGGAQAGGNNGSHETFDHRGMGGGGGGYSARTFSAGELTPGSTITVTVGSGGARAWNGGQGNGSSQVGGSGRVIINAILNQPPPAPTITGPNTGYISVANTYTFSGANDPENDTIRYAIDWDNNGTVDAYAPNTGYSPNNSGETASYTWNTPGAKTFQARSEDSRGGVSGWTPYNVTIGDVPTVIVTASTTAYRGGDSAIGFTWSSSESVTCTGTNLDTGGATSGHITLTPTTTTTYTVTCTSPGGSDADSITVNFTANQPPNTPTITGPTTGRTGSTYTYTVTGSDPDGDAVRFGVDFNGDDIVDSWTNW